MHSLSGSRNSEHQTSRSARWTLTPAEEMEGVPCRGLVFFLGREVPQEQLLVVIRAFGGQVGWDGEESPFQEGDSSITHQVCWL